jgi:hypothetical protein
MMQLSIPPDYTLLIAMWGAALSTLLSLVKLIEFYRERPRVLIRAEFGSETLHWDTTRAPWRGLCVRLVNVGRRNAFIREVRIKLRGNTDICTLENGRTTVSLGNHTHWLLCPFPLPEEPTPLKLEEGEQHVFSEDIGLKDERLFEGAECVVELTSGKKVRSQVYSGLR